MTAILDAQVQALAEKRAQLTSPLERIVFDNDPANGPIVVRLLAMAASKDRP